MYIENLTPDLKTIGKVLLYIVLVEPIYTILFLVRILKILF